jgi:glutaredoxin
MKFTPTASAAGTLLAALLMTPGVWAQYKVVGPDGRITYTDKPPAAGANAPSGANGGVDSAATLPLVVRQAVAKYPVTLFTSKDCAPCDQGRQLLQGRGVPYSESRIDTPADIEALARSTGSRSLPTLRIGTQVLKGLTSADWGDYLTAAGYPRTSQLPANYRFADPAPLTTPTAAPAAPQPAAPQPGNAPAPAPAPPPTGIRF